MAKPTLRDADVWDARAETDIALMIQRYLRHNPPPAGSAVARDFEEWARALEADGRARLSHQQARSLRAVPVTA